MTCQETDQVHGGEFGSGSVVAIVVKHAQARRLELLVKCIARRIGRGVASFPVDEADVE